MDKKLIIIAEDEVAYGRILKDALENEEYAIAVVLNGEDLLKAIRVREPGLILLDLVMPVKNGFEVLTEMKKDDKLKHIKVIALSNLGQEEDIERAKKLGADDYIVKSDETFYAVIDKIEKLFNHVGKEDSL